MTWNLTVQKCQYILLLFLFPPRDLKFVRLTGIHSQYGFSSVSQTVGRVVYLKDFVTFHWPGLAFCTGLNKTPGKFVIIFSNAGLKLSIFQISHSTVP
jgi:hypothetical protein